MIMPGDQMFWFKAGGDQYAVPAPDMDAAKQILTERGVKWDKCVPFEQEPGAQPPGVWVLRKDADPS